MLIFKLLSVRIDVQLPHQNGSVPDSGRVKCDLHPISYMMQKIERVSSMSEYSTSKLFLVHITTGVQFSRTGHFGHDLGKRLLAAELEDHLNFYSE